MIRIDKQRAIELAKKAGRSASGALSAIPKVLFDVVKLLDAGEFEVTVNKTDGFRMYYSSRYTEIQKGQDEKDATL